MFFNSFYLLIPYTTLHPYKYFIKAEWLIRLINFHLCWFFDLLLKRVVILCFMILLRILCIIWKIHLLVLLLLWYFICVLLVCSSRWYRNVSSIFLFDRSCSFRRLYMFFRLHNFFLLLLSHWWTWSRLFLFLKLTSLPLNFEALRFMTLKPVWRCLCYFLRLQISFFFDYGSLDTIIKDFKKLISFMRCYFLPYNKCFSSILPSFWIGIW